MPPRDFQLQQMPGGLPPFPPPEPLIMPPRPGRVEIASMMPAAPSQIPSMLRPATTPAIAPPSIYVKVTRYSDVMNSIAQMKAVMADLKRSLDEIRNAHEQERRALDVFDSVLQRLNATIDFFEQTLTSSEEQQ